MPELTSGETGEDDERRIRCRAPGRYGRVSCPSRSAARGASGYASLRTRQAARYCSADRRHPRRAVWAVLFRYGAVVLFGATTAALDNFVASLRPLVAAALPDPGTGRRAAADPAGGRPVSSTSPAISSSPRRRPNGCRWSPTSSPRVWFCRITRRGLPSIFDGIEPLAAVLREKGRAGARGKELLRHIGDVLLMQQKMVGRVETGEKPELLWDHPELERLYVRLAEEYELRDRDRALDRKLDVISRTVETLLGLVQARSSLRVEWYIVLLIVAELLLSTYPLLLGR